MNAAFIAWWRAQLGGKAPSYSRWLPFDRTRGGGTANLLRGRPPERSRGNRH